MNPQCDWAWGYGGMNGVLPNSFTILLTLMCVGHFSTFNGKLNYVHVCRDSKTNWIVVITTTTELFKKSICSEYPKFLLLYLFNSECFAYTQILKVRMTMMINRKHKICTCSQVIQKPYLHHLNRLLSLMALTVSQFCLNGDGHQEKTPQLCQ